MNKNPVVPSPSEVGPCNALSWTGPSGPRLLQELSLKSSTEFTHLVSCFRREKQDLCALKRWAWLLFTSCLLLCCGGMLLAIPAACLKSLVCAVPGRAFVPCGVTLADICPGLPLLAFVTLYAANFTSVNLLSSLDGRVRFFLLFPLMLVSQKVTVPILLA